MEDQPRTAACLAVGSELLGSTKLDRNSLTITAALAELGIPVTEKRVVGDAEEAISEAIRELLDRHHLVVLTGGLGPTADDVTRDAVARALDRTIDHDDEVEDWIRQRYRDLGREVPKYAPAMARVVDGCAPLRNNRGTAPGMMCSVEGRVLAVFPGVPWEMEEMLERDLLPELADWRPGEHRRSRTMLLGGVFESDVEERIRDLYERFGRDDISILASFGVVRLVLSATGSEDDVEHRLDDMERAFRDRLGDDVVAVGVDGLAEAVIAELRRRGASLATAESCTGGLVSVRLTDVPGASDGFVGGVVSYSNEVKENQLGVSHDTLVEHGAVSEEVARAMASGVRSRLDADWGIGITGIAGPTGGTEDKPVGLVHWAVAGPDGVSAEHRIFRGSRSVVREWSCNSALDLLRRCLSGLR